MEATRLFTALIAPLTALALVVVAVQPVKRETATVFDQPAVRAQASQMLARMIAHAGRGDRTAALRIAEDICRLTPQSAAAHYNLACLQSLSGQLQAAFHSAQSAVDLGFRDPEMLQKDPDLAAIRDDPRFAAILSQARKPFAPTSQDPNSLPDPLPVREGTAVVTPGNTRWLESRGTLLTTFSFDVDPIPASDLAVVGTEPADLLVQRWLREGTAAGHTGDLYDNRDRRHSLLNLRRFPQLARVEYCDEAKQSGIDWGIQVQHQFNCPTLGNSSTAQVGEPWWRSNPRLFLYSDALTRLVYNQYVSNHLYVYPEHNDYDAVRGDVYPAHVPYCVISQGSSGSDRPFLDAIALTMAALRPAVKQKLVSAGLLMPAIQAILRRSCRKVLTDDDYLSWKAHPIVFQAEDLDVLRMVQLAQNLQTDHLPPMIQLKVLEEDPGVPGRDYFHSGPGERLFDTPAAIARLYRTAAGQRRMVVDASASVDLNRRPLSFRWVLLQGDPERVSIRQLNASGSTAEIIFRWHESHPVPGRSELMSNRVDVGVFAYNGDWFSAPGFVTSFSFRNEKRHYDASQRIRSIDYGASGFSGHYVDPLIDISKNWRDEYHYTDDGQLVGWARQIPGQPQQQFHRDGTLILDFDPHGRPLETRVVRYVASPTPRGTRRLVPELTDQRMRWEYRSDQDREGRATPVMAEIVPP